MTNGRSDGRAVLVRGGESVQQPLMYYRNNVSKTVELLDAMREAGVRNPMFSSTAAVYGQPESVPISEAHPLHPTSPYGSTKAVIERLLSEVEAADGLRHVSLRCFSAAGAYPERLDAHQSSSLMQLALGQHPAAQVFGLDWPAPDDPAVLVANADRIEREFGWRTRTQRP